MLVSSTVAGAAPVHGNSVWIAHGILGSGRNWRAFARRLVERCPSWRVVLVDLRHHGESHGQTGPDTVRACAADLAELSATTEPPRVMIGHSFGGKVTLAYAELAPPGLAAAWVLDAIPVALGVEALDDEVVRVIDAVSSLTPPFSSHDEVLAAMRGAGFSELLAGWMTTNLQRGSDGLVWRFNLDGVRRLLRSYAETDLTGVLRAPQVPLHLVRAGRSSRWTPALLEHLAGIQHADLHWHLMPDAGHWLHVDDPEGLLDLLAAGLRDTEAASHSLRLS